VAVASSALFVAAPLVRGFAFTNGLAGGLPFYTWFNIDGLAIGALLAVLARTISRRAFARTGMIMLAAGLAGGAAMFILGQWSRKSPGGAAFQSTALYAIFAGTLTLSLIIGSSPRRALVRIPLLQSLGYISYGLYLVHYLCFTTFDRLADKGNVMSLGFVLVRFTVAGGAAIAFAVLSRIYFENYFLAMKNRKPPLLEHQIA
jgi:peptidoglycan/LPS O-acetylase OafA/YrhL